MHHGNPSDPAQHPEIVKKVRKAMKEIGEPLGATGQHPLGHLTPADEGEIRVVVVVDKEHQKVIIDFGKPVAWIGLTPQQARALAELLRKRSHEAQGK